jgi:ABC-type transporter Mla maintaining outer membrane lipid asymmetry permease subunit MlaE
LLGIFPSILGFSGRLFRYWLDRRFNQAAMAGRIFRLGGLVFSSPPSRRKLMRRLILYQAIAMMRSSILLTAVFGLMVGYLWAVIWFGALANLGGASNLISLLVSVQMQTVSPILVTIAIIMSYGGPMALEIALLKSGRQFETLTLMGIPPEHLLAWPRIIGPVLAFPALLLVMNACSAGGAFLGIWQSIELPIFEFLLDASHKLEVFNLFKLAVQSVLITVFMCFFCLYNGWQIEVGQNNLGPVVARKAMAESFIFSTLAGVLVTVLYGS